MKGIRTSVLATLIVFGSFAALPIVLPGATTPAMALPVRSLKMSPVHPKVWVNYYLAVRGYCDPLGPWGPAKHERIAWGLLGEFRGKAVDTTLGAALDAAITAAVALPRLELRGSATALQRTDALVSAFADTARLDMLSDAGTKELADELRERMADAIQELPAAVGLADLQQVWDAQTDDSTAPATEDEQRYALLMLGGTVTNGELAGRIAVVNFGLRGLPGANPDPEPWRVAHALRSKLDELSLGLSSAAQADLAAAAKVQISAAVRSRR